MDAQRKIDENIKVHDRIAHAYDKGHGEIFNPIEQARLAEDLGLALKSVLSAKGAPRALDFGCGSGNLTRPLLGLGCEVTAADVSQHFLDLVGARFGEERLSTLRLNGVDLGNVPTGTFDFVATYSVLHHIPDYLAAIKEMGRVCKVGGVVYLDHEPPEHHWRPDPVYAQFKAAAATTDWRKFLIPSNYYGKLRRMLWDPKYAPEGDIHVWPDDHIEWSRIEARMAADGFEVVEAKDYLLYRAGYREAPYDAFKGRCTDMRLMAFRKR